MQDHTITRPDEFVPVRVRIFDRDADRDILVMTQAARGIDGYHSGRGYVWNGNAALCREENVLVTYSDGRQAVMSEPTLREIHPGPYATTAAGVGGATDAHRRDIALIGDHMSRLARDNSWCGVYDRAVEQLNEELTVTIQARC